VPVLAPWTVFVAILPSLKSESLWTICEVVSRIARPYELIPAMAAWLRGYVQARNTHVGGSVGEIFDKRQDTRPEVDRMSILRRLNASGAEHLLIRLLSRNLVLTSFW